MLPLLSKTAELISGYSITQRIGAGGYGEVWKADAPGGLVKAIKFVYGCLDEQRATHELRALNRIKQVRHPFLLSLERIEVIDGQLVIITELADCSLKDRFEEHRAAGRSGIPRDELLVYLHDAADALDYMSQAHSLQHLDVKPENLLIVGGRVKVGDFGLVKDVCTQSVSMLSGLTPIYAAPEVFDNRPSSHSDQYSLAIVYQELLTGTFPFPGRTPSQLAAQHTCSNPRLSVLPPADRPVVARALSKSPVDRFPSCRAMIESLGRPGDSARGSAAMATGAPGSPGDTTSLHRPSQDTGSRPVAPKPSGSRPVSTDTRTLLLNAIAAGEVDEVDDEDLPGVESPAMPAGPRAAEVWINGLAALAKEPTPDAVDPPPLEIAAENARLRPTLILGLGGTALKTLGHLRRRLGDRFGDASAVPAIRCLLVETDSRAASAAIRPDGPVRLAPSDTIVVPLRRSQDYRNEASSLLRWISRRWLFNIPRSQQTEGIRPLGRLALIEHYAKIREEIRSAIAQTLDPEVLAQSSQATRMTAEADSPRVFLVASLSSGTGGGMALDMAHLVRDVLDEMNLPGGRIIGLFTHSTPRVPHAKMLAMANTCAALSELHHDATFSTTEETPRRPLDQTYVVHLGDDLDEPRFDAATADLAEYLCLNTAGPTNDFFEAARRQETDSAENQAETRPVLVRTFGLCQMGAAGHGLSALAAETLVGSLLQRWRGHAARAASPAGATANAPHAEPPGIENIPDLQLDVGQLAGQVNRLVQNELGPEAAAQFRTALEAHLTQFRSTSPGGFPYGVLLEAVRNVVEPNDAIPAMIQGLPRLSPSAVDEAIDAMAARQGQAICRWIVELVETADHRLDSALEAAGWLTERLRQLESRLNVMREQVRSAISQTERALATGKVAEPSRWSLGRHRKAGDESLNHAEEYFRLRLDQIALDGTQTLLRSIRGRVAKTTDQLRDLDTQLAGLGRQLDSATSWDDLPPGSQSLPSIWDDFHRAMADQLRRRLTDLARQLDAQVHADLIDQHGGIFSLAQETPGLDAAFLETLRRAARNTVAVAVRDLDVARWITGPDQLTPGDDSPTLLRSSLELCNPRLPQPGGSSRLLLACPTSAGPTLAQAYAAEGVSPPTMVPDPSGNILLCREVAGIPLDRLAAALLAPRPDCAHLALRLHTRTDLPWSPMP